MVCSSGCKQFGGVLTQVRKGGASGAPLSYLNPRYQEPSGPTGSNRLIAEPLLARPSLNHTGGSRRKNTRKTRKSRRGGWVPTIMGPFVPNAARLVPAAAVQGYRMVRNYKSSSRTRKNRK